MFQGKIVLRNDSSINWTTVNPILSLGEPAFDRTTGAFYVGDGVKTFSQLVPINADSVTPYELKTSSFTAVRDKVYLASGTGIVITAPTTVEGSFKIYVDSNNTSTVSFNGITLSEGEVVHVFANSNNEWSIHQLMPIFEGISGGSASS